MDIWKRNYSQLGYNCQWHLVSCLPLALLFLSKYTVFMACRAICHVDIKINQRTILFDWSKNCSISMHIRTILANPNPNPNRNSWPWHMTLTFSLGRAMAMARTHTKHHDQRSVGLKPAVETDGQTDATECISFPTNAVVICSWRFAAPAVASLCCCAPADSGTDRQTRHRFNTLNTYAVSA